MSEQFIVTLKDKGFDPDPGVRTTDYEGCVSDILYMHRTQEEAEEFMAEVKEKGSVHVDIVHHEDGREFDLTIERVES